MSLDLFVGPLCRLYARDFETATTSPTPRAAGADEPATAAELLPAILGWRRLITPQFRSAGVTLIDWDESPSGAARAAPLGWGPYWSLRLLAAYDENPSLHRPDTEPDDLSTDPGLIAIRDDFLRSRYPHLHACEFWLPLRCADPVTVQLPTEQTRPVGSVGMLRAELDSLRKRALDADTRAQLATIAADAAQTPLVRAAAATLDLWLPLCDHALERRLPMVLDG